jgi:hypothetical protein
MKKTRRRYDRAFKISVVSELESDNPLAQIAASITSIRPYPHGGEMSRPRILKRRSVGTEISTRTKRGLPNWRDCSENLIPRAFRLQISDYGTKSEIMIDRH